jgi:hypothetical protein
MHEGDPTAVRSPAGGLVDEPHPARLQLPECPVEVVHLHADVVEARAPLQEAGDHRARLRGLEQLEVRVPHREKGGAHLLGWDVAGRLDAEAEGLEGGDRLRQARHGDPQMIDPDGLHRESPIRCTTSSAAESGSSVRSASRATVSSMSAGESTWRRT